jgi:hypothetical protein
MTQTTSVKGQQWDAIVTRALDASGIDGTVTLGGSTHPVTVPFGLPALMTALVQFMAPETPARLRVYAWVRDIGCLLEVCGGRELAFLPDQLNELAERLGVQLNFIRLPSSCAVLLTLPSNVAGY